MLWFKWKWPFSYFCLGDNYVCILTILHDSPQAFRLLFHKLSKSYNFSGFLRRYLDALLNSPEIVKPNIIMFEFYKWPKGYLSQCWRQHQRLRLHRNPPTTNLYDDLMERLRRLCFLQLWNSPPPHTLCIAWWCRQGEGLLKQCARKHKYGKRLWFCAKTEKIHTLLIFLLSNGSLSRASVIIIFYSVIYWLPVLQNDWQKLESWQKVWSLDSDTSSSFHVELRADWMQH